MDSVVARQVDLWIPIAVHSAITAMCASSVSGRWRGRWTPCWAGDDPDQTPPGFLAHVLRS